MRIIRGMMLIAAALAGCGGGGDGSGSSPPPVLNPPTIASISPSSATAGSGAVTLTVNGTNFVSSSVVDWNGTALSTTYASATKLSAAVPATDVSTSGTASITVVNSAADGGTSSGATFTINAASGGGGTGGGGSGPQLTQWNTYQTTGNNTEVNSSLQFKTLTKAGDTLWVAVTVSDFAGVHAISVSDTQGNQYTALEQENDVAPGNQSVAHFYASKIAGDSTTPDTVNITWTTDDYKGIVIAEISGTASAEAVGHAGNIQDGLAAGANNVTAGPINVSAAGTPALLIALSMNTSGGASDTGGSGASGPAAGSALTQVAQFWDYGANLATLATASISGAESITAAFNAPDTDSYVTVAAVFH